MRRARLTINNTGLEFDRDYGCDHRTGWTALVGGRVMEPQLTSLWRAVKALAAGLWRRGADE